MPKLTKTTKAERRAKERPEAPKPVTALEILNHTKTGKSLEAAVAAAQEERRLRDLGHK